MISDRAMRVILVVIGVYHVATGVLALVDAHTFFDQIGRYGVENDHYAFDVGEARSDARGVFDTVALAIGALVSAYLAWAASRLRQPREAIVSPERERVR